MTHFSEDEARKRWCPFARIEAATSAINRLDVGEVRWPIGCRCIASACMAWRWWNDPAPPKAREGFCGLARQPE